MDSHIAVVHLIDNRIFRTAKSRTHIFSPTFWIGTSEVNHRSTTTIHADSLCKDTWSLVQCPTRTMFYYLKGIELTIQVTFYRLYPTAIFLTTHRERLQWGYSSSIRIQIQINRIRIRAPYRECGLLWRIHHLLQRTLFHRIRIHIFIMWLLCATTC